LSFQSEEGTYGVEKGVALDFGTAAAEMVDIVPFHSDQIVGPV
jgi:hypothetical protein